MAKLKKAKVTVTICPTCKGNGFLKVATEKTCRSMLGL